MEEIFPKFMENDFRNSSKMIESNFMKKFSTVTTILENFNAFLAKFEYLKKVHPNGFSKIHFVIDFHPSHH